MKRLNRDAVTAMIVIQMLAEGVYFDSASAYRIPAGKGIVWRTMKALESAGVVARSRARKKFLLTDEFLEYMRQEITKRMPRGTFVHHPDLTVFEMCGLGDWSAEELNAYIKRLTDRWMLRKGVSAI